MKRVRISTTVDGERLRIARALGDRPDAELFDRALTLFIQTVEGERERAVLLAHPYEHDAELELPDADAALPYAGEVPADVVRIAEQRRRAS